jgi:hypothetical protein
MVMDRIVELTCLQGFGGIFLALPPCSLPRVGGIA